MEMSELERSQMAELGRMYQKSLRDLDDFLAEMQNWHHPRRSLHHLPCSFDAIVDDHDNNNNNKNDNVVVDICPHDYAADLNLTNFDAALRDTPCHLCFRRILRPLLIIL